MQYRNTFLSSFLFVLSLVSTSRADEAPILAGFENSTARSGGGRYPGILLQGGTAGYSSPAIAEIDGDPSNGKEIAVGGSDGILYVYTSTGSLLWSHALPNASCKTGSTNRLFASPAVGAIFGDGVPYVVAGYGGLGSKNCDGGVAAFRGSNGAQAWVFSTTEFAKKERFWTNMHGVFSSPALADTDGDGKMEIGFGSFDRSVYLLNADGSVRWYYQAADTVWSSPAFANVDSTPQLEMIVGTDISQNKLLRPPTKNGGNLYAFKTQARKPVLLRFRQPDAFVWQRAFDQVIFSSPVVGNVLASNPGKEIVVGSGCFFPQHTNNKKGRWIKILRPRDGTVLATLTTTGCSPSSQALADIDGDGVSEIFATINGHTSIGGDGNGRVAMYRPPNPNPIWSVIPKDRGTQDPFLGEFKSPVIADVDGNGSLEVLVSTNSSIAILDAATGIQLSCSTSSCGKLPFLVTGGGLRNSPAVGDINNDGKLDVVAAGISRTERYRGALFAWTGLSGMLKSTPGTFPLYSAPWPMIRGGAEHTGREP